MDWAEIVGSWGGSCAGLRHLGRSLPACIRLSGQLDSSTYTPILSLIPKPQNLHHERCPSNLKPRAFWGARSDEFRVAGVELGLGVAG